MNTRTLQELLLTHYLFAIEMVKGAKDFDECFNVTADMAVYNGICHCAVEVFDKHIYVARWVKKYCSRGEWWGLKPSNAYNKTNILRCLQIRVDNLQKELACSTSTN